MKQLEQKVRGELFDNNQRDFTCSTDFQNGYDRALRLVLRWLNEKSCSSSFDKAINGLEFTFKQLMDKIESLPCWYNMKRNTKDSLYFIHNASIRELKSYKPKKKDDEVIQLQLPDMFNPKEYKKLKKFCNKDNDSDYQPDTGVAYQNIKSKRIMCMEDCDLFRGRGKPKECRGLNCKNYFYVNPNQTTLDQFQQHSIFSEEISDFKETFDINHHRRSHN